MHARPLDDLLKVAQESGMGGAQLAEAHLPSGAVLVVRYERRYERGYDQGPGTEYVVVEPGHWLACNPGSGALYEADDADWEQFYDRVQPG